MNRNFYTFGIVFVLLLVIASLFQSIIYFQLGREMYILSSFHLWYACLSAATFLGTVIVLKYLRHKNYQFSFWAAIFFMAAAILQFIVVYLMLTGTAGMTTYYIPVVFFTLAANVVYAVSLIFTAARKRPWLKGAGVFIFLLSLTLVSTIIWSMNPPEAWKFEVAESIYQWASLIGSAAPLFYVFNFVEERKRLTAGDDRSLSSQPAIVQGLLMTIAAVLFSVTLVIGTNFYTESYWSYDWKKKGPERARRLAEPFEARKFANSQGDTLPYRLFTPMDYDSSRKYPLVICLHHGGTHGADNLMQIDGSPAAQVLYEQRTKYPAFLFVPQCPEGTSWGGVPNLPAIDNLVLDCVAALEQEFSIDDKRRYVIGISGGGYGSWHFISSRPGMFAAAVPICGGGNATFAANMADVAVWAFHGERDNAVPVTFTRDIVSSIKKAGGNPRYTEFPGAGHNIWEQVIQTPGLLDWMFEQKRE